MAMACERYLNAIHELVDGTLGQIRRSELELHLDSCDDCRALVADLREIADVSRSLGPIEPPARVWTQIATRLQQEGLVAGASGMGSWHRNATMLALAAALVLAVGASLFVLRPRQAPAPAPASETAAADPAPAPAGNVEAGDVVQSLEKSAANLETAVEQAKKLRALDPETTAALQGSIHVVNEALADTRARLNADPQDIAAQQSFYETLKQKIQFLQNTITLMNEMRQGDAAGAAQIVEGGKS
jgi:anti-sigma factor RsiW